MENNDKTPMPTPDYDAYKLAIRLNEILVEVTAVFEARRNTDSPMSIENYKELLEMLSDSISTLIGISTDPMFSYIRTPIIHVE